MHIHNQRNHEHQENQRSPSFIMRILLLTFCAVCIVIPSGAKATNTLDSNSRSAYSSTTISVYSLYRKGNVEYTNRTGIMEDGTRGMTVGFGISKAFYLKALPPNAFLSIGLKHYLAKTQVDVLSSIYGPNITVVGNVQLTHRFVSVPILLGKTFYTKGSRNALNLFGGVSFGMVGISKVSYSMEYRRAKDDNVEPPVDYASTPTSRKNTIYAALEGGATYVPARNLPGLSFGITATYDLIRTPGFDNAGMFVNTTNGNTTYHRYSVFTRYLHAALSANYTFGKKWKAQR